MNVLLILCVTLCMCTAGPLLVCCVGIDSAVCILCRFGVYVVCALCVLCAYCV